MKSPYKIVKQYYNISEIMQITGLSSYKVKKVLKDNNILIFGRGSYKIKRKDLFKLVDYLTKIKRQKAT